MVVAALGGLRRAGVPQVEGAAVPLPHQLIAGVAPLQGGGEGDLFQVLAGELGAVIPDLELIGGLLQPGEGVGGLTAGDLQLQGAGGAGGDLEAAGGPAQLAAVLGDGIAAEVGDVDLALQHVTLLELQGHLAALVAADLLLLAVEDVGHLVAGGAQQGGGGHIAVLVHQPVVEVVGAGVELGGGGDHGAALVGELGHQVHVGLVVDADVGHVSGVAQGVGARLQGHVIDGDVAAEAGVDAEGARADAGARALFAVAGVVLQAGIAHRGAGGVLQGDAADAAALDKEDQLVHGYVEADLAAGGGQLVPAEDHVAHVGELAQHVGAV